MTCVIYLQQLNTNYPISFLIHTKQYLSTNLLYLEYTLEYLPNNIVNDKCSI